MKQSLNPAVARVLKRLHYPLDVILMCVRWYVAYPLSLRHIEEMVADLHDEVATRIDNGSWLVEGFGMVFHRFNNFRG
jgi:hypothetical protein